MKRKLLKTMITASVIASVVAPSTVYANEVEDLQKDFAENDALLRRSHADIFPVKHSIMGGTDVSEQAFLKFLKSQQNKYNFDYKLTCSIEEWVSLVYQEAKVEGVRADIVVAQAIKETGYFKFGGLLTYQDNNFAGIGVTGKPGEKNSFADARTGIRAQVQHLKAYASTDALVNACVDPRFNLVSRGSAPSLEELAGRWAYPGYVKSQYSSLEEAAKHNATYGQEIYKIIDSARAFEGDNSGSEDSNETDSKPTTPEAPAIISKGKIKGITSSLNVRSGAGTNYSVVSSLKNNQNINIYEKTGNWYKIDYSVNSTTHYGYISAEYVQITDNTKPTPNPTPSVPDVPSDNNQNQQAKEGQVTGISSRLNIRSGAGTNYSVITTVTNNTKLTINSEVNGWYNVTLADGRKGYVSAKYVKVISNSNAGNNNSESIKKGKVTGINTVLNVRSGASMSSSVVTYLRNGENVEIIGESGSWYKIKSSKSGSAYVSKTYIKLV